MVGTDRSDAKVPLWRLKMMICVTSQRRCPLLGARHEHEASFKHPFVPPGEGGT